MTELATSDDYGVLIEPATLRIERLLPGPIERVWAYLTDSDLRRQWLAEGHMEMKVGAPLELVWRNDELSNGSGSSDEQRMQSRITELDPPHKIAITWAGSGDVVFELKASGNKVLLTLTHHRLPNRATLLEVSAGWHMHLDILIARATNQEPSPFWEGWRLLKNQYDQRLPA